MVVVVVVVKGRCPRAELRRVASRDNLHSDRAALDSYRPTRLDKWSSKHTKDIDCFGMAPKPVTVVCGAALQFFCHSGTHNFKIVRTPICARCEKSELRKAGMDFTRSQSRDEVT